MLTCPNPTCQKPVAENLATCSHCQTDLSLLVNYVGEVNAALERAQSKTKAGELADAVWAYLALLELDPDNPEAKKQVSMVAAAVRHFDDALAKKRGLAPIPQTEFPPWAVPAAIAGWTLIAMLAGYYLG